MAIKITISDRVTFKVAGSYTNATGGAEAFDFHLTARRLLQEELNARLPDVAEGRERIDAFLADIVTDWKGVLDDEGKPVAFGAESLAALLNGVPGSAGLALSAYLDAVRARAKN